MAKLTPNSTYFLNGVKVNEKIIPDGTKWKDDAKAKACGFRAGQLYKKQMDLSNDTGKVQFVTIHNTDDLDHVEDDGEQYTRATYNENMKSVRVHLYVDDLCAWQNLRMGTKLCPSDITDRAEVGWHAGDGSSVSGGNMTSIAIEVIMNDSKDHDAKAYANAVKIAAWLLWKNNLSIDKLVTHTYWVNKSLGKTFKNVDEQCTNYVKGYKWCPRYIFGSTSKDVAYKNWMAFKNKVAKEVSRLKDPTPEGVLYRVQVGAFEKKANAYALMDKLKSKGFGGFVVHADGLWKVQVGAFTSRSNAENLKAKVKAAGFAAFIVKVENNPSPNPGTSGNTPQKPSKTSKEIALEIHKGKCSDPRWDSWGTGEERKKRLKSAGYNPTEVQAELNKIYK